MFPRPVLRNRAGRRGNRAPHWLCRHTAPTDWLPRLHPPKCCRQPSCALAQISGSPNARPARCNPTPKETLAEPWPRQPRLRSSHTVRGFPVAFQSCSLLLPIPNLDGGLKSGPRPPSHGHTPVEALPRIYLNNVTSSEN